MRRLVAGDPRRSHSKILAPRTPIQATFIAYRKGFTELLQKISKRDLNYPERIARTKACYNCLCLQSARSQNCSVASGWFQFLKTCRRSSWTLAVEISEQRNGDVVVLGPIGRIDNDTSPDFQAKLLNSVGSDGARVLVNLSGVDYISSAGLRALMMASKQSKATEGKLAVAALGPVVQEIFTISRFALVVQVFDTPGEAIEALRE